MVIAAGRGLLNGTSMGVSPRKAVCASVAARSCADAVMGAAG